MNPSLQDHPVSNREQWLDARRRLLAREKQLTRLRDQVAAEKGRNEDAIMDWLRHHDRYDEAPKSACCHAQASH
ncbi:DUF899 family protein [Pseudomonas aeruginosa]|nr:DUF899 family protein [Pseudomonas aeruginosa]